jgi:hypothetical protein
MEDKIKMYYDKLSELFLEMINDGIEPSINTETRNGIIEDYGIKLKGKDERMIDINIYLSMRWFS